MYCYNCGKELEAEARYCSLCGTAKASPQPEARDRRPFTRIREGKKIAGVCGGVARHLDLDVTLVRVLWLSLTIFLGVLPGVVAYLVCWIVMSQDPPMTPVTPDTVSVPTHTASA
jgi:phage shock protein PspC (stress-responsive transcriptional regulator)